MQRGPLGPPTIAVQTSGGPKGPPYTRVELNWNVVAKLKNESRGRHPEPGTLFPRFAVKPPPVPDSRCPLVTGRTTVLQDRGRFAGALRIARSHDFPEVLLTMAENLHGSRKRVRDENEKPENRRRGNSNIWITRSANRARVLPGSPRRTRRSPESSCTRSASREVLRTLDA
jgi:hypothetical protein